MYNFNMCMYLHVFRDEIGAKVKNILLRFWFGFEMNTRIVVEIKVRFGITHIIRSVLAYLLQIILKLLLQ